MDEQKDKNSISPNAYSLFSAENPQNQAYVDSLVIEQTDDDEDTENFHEASNHIGSVSTDMSSSSGIAVDNYNGVYPEIHDTPASFDDHASREMDTNPFAYVQTSNDYSPMSEEIEFKDHLLSDEQQQKTEVKDVQHNEKNASKGLIDTAAPFASVKAAVNKFGGTVDWKAQKAMPVEKRRNPDVDLESIQEDLPKLKKQSDDAEFVNMQLLEQLHSTNKLVEELKLNLEKTETEALQAKQDTELAELRVKEMEQGIANDASVAAKAQLDVAKERHQNAIAELASVRQELEELQKDHIFLVDGMDTETAKAQESVSDLKEIEKTVEDLTLELITTKSVFESVQSAHIEAEEQKIGSVLAWEQDKVKWEKELKLAEEELQHHNEQLLLATDLKSKFEEACTLLATLKSQLAIHIEARKDATNIDCTNTEEGYVPFELAKTRNDLIEVKSSVDKVKDELNCLRNISHSLQSDLEMEQTSMTTLRQKEALAIASISSLQGEINRTATELELVLTKEKEATEKKADLPKTLQLAAEEADQAKSLVLLAHEELKKAKDESEQLKAGLSTMETRLDAALKEIKAAKMSEKLATSTLNALKESEIKEPENSPRRVTLPVDEYYTLMKKAQEAEELGNNKVMCAYEQIKVIKASKLRSIEKLEDANLEMEERMKVLQSAIEKAEEASESKLLVEDELRKWRGEHEQLRTDSDLYDEFGIDDDNISDTVSELVLDSPTSSTSSKLRGKGSESRFRKRSFLPRILMFLARKKAQSYK